MVNAPDDLTPDPEPEKNSAQRRFRISADALDFSGLDEDQAEDVRFLWRYCVDRDLSKQEIEKLLKKSNGRDTYSYDSVYQLFTGRRAGAKASVIPICEAIAAFRRSVDEQPVKDGFKETRLFGELKTYVDLVRRRGLLGFVFGNYTIGKTTNLEEIARRDPKVTYTRMGTRGHLNRYLKGLAKKRAMGDRQTVLDLSDRIIDSFESNEVLIVDEADQCFAGAKSQLGLATLDFLRELWDRRRVPILFVMDHTGRDALKSGTNKKRLGRLWRRRVPALHLADVPYPEDLALFAAGYKLPPAPEAEIEVEEKGVKISKSPAKLQAEVLKDPNGGLLVWLGILDDAKDMAADKKRPMSWGAVIKAHASFIVQETESVEAK